MLHYRVSLQDDDDTVFVTSPDFPELTTFGDDGDEAIARAADALEEAIAARIAARQDIPEPSAGGTRVKVPTLTAIKALLYQGMRDQGIGKAELARRLGWHLPQVDRVLDVRHSSRLDRMDLALSAIGLQIEIRARETGSDAQR
ncbi:MAG: type II toxin-antitoxin system HicB family antitoxin [Paracoccaceae bacterium]|nr:type II toxin-antitoxin system HicB family antitoxin [Paracoccaceae bacterium]